MQTAPLFAALAASLMLGGSALGQTTQPSPSMPVDPRALTAPSASQAGIPASAMIRDSSAPLGSSANPIPENSPTPPDQAWSLIAGDASVVSNGPIPDTRANRAKYGQPLSATGRATRPAGN